MCQDIAKEVYRKHKRGEQKVHALLKFVQGLPLFSLMIMNSLQLLSYEMILKEAYRKYNVLHLWCRILTVDFDLQIFKLEDVLQDEE